MLKKKLLNVLAILSFLIGTMNANAEKFEWNWTPKYQGEINLGYKTTTKVQGIDTYSQLAELGTVQGVSLNQYLFLGVGIDALMFTHYYKGNGLRFAMDTYFDIRPTYPVTDNFKVYLDLGLGAYYSIKSEPSVGHDFFCQFGPGFRYRKLNFCLGLQSMGTGNGSTGFFTKIGLYF